SCDHRDISIQSCILTTFLDKCEGEQTHTSTERPTLASCAVDMEGCVHRRVPLALREELYHILLSRILNCLLPFVVTMFCGRLGNEMMAGYGLASATINITTAATGYGLGLACDTLVSQTFGGKNLLRVGVILQRAIIILLLFCLPCWGLLINAEAILLCMRQDPEVASLLFCVFKAMFLHHLQVSYLQNQGIILPQMYTAAMANIANVITNYIFLYWLDLGVNGSAAANTLSQIYICGLLFAYIRWKKLHVTTWGGWSVESLQEWGSYMKLAIPSTFMKCFEWWVYEFGGFFAGMLSEDELAAQHAVIMVAFITYMFPLGIQAAACARVGNALGAGDTERAIFSSKVSLTLAVEGVVLGSCKSCVCTGIFLGTGKQKIPAVANLIGYYGIGLSLSVTLTFAAKLRVLGFWLGLLICVILQSTFYIIVIFKLNWKRMTEEVNLDGYVSGTAVRHDGNMETQGAHVQQVKAGHLSTAQLILRRGLTVLGVVALLVVGITVHFLVPLPKTPPTEANFTMDWINTTYAPDHTFPIV
uniref:Multidrug and toxin extrusion protein n=1 Tax=Sphaeramia orbicularis TaxID=375764 RepID=A0A673ACC1_9TELE